MNSALEALLNQAKAAGESAALAIEEGNKNPYLAPSDEPLTWDTRGIVRLDAAILAVHLATARIALRNVPEQLRQRLLSIEQAAVKYVIGKAVGEAAKFVGIKILGRFVFLLKEVYVAWEQTKLEEAVESQIRRAVLRTMREVLKMKMKPKKNRVRRTRRIASRNPRPKK